MNNLQQMIQQERKSNSDIINLLNQILQKLTLNNKREEVQEVEPDVIAKPDVIAEPDVISKEELREKLNKHYPKKGIEFLCEKHEISTKHFTKKKLIEILIKSDIKIVLTEIEKFKYKKYQKIQKKRGKSNEDHGICCENTVCTVNGIVPPEHFAKRITEQICLDMTPCIELFKERNPHIIPKKHTGHKNGKNDFILNNGETLSCKANLKRSGLLAPQIDGQPSRCVFDTMHNLPYGGKKDSDLNRKKYIQEIENIVKLVKQWWVNFWCCDNLLWVYGHQGQWISRFFSKEMNMRNKFPFTDATKFEFSQTPESWNDSCAIRYVLDTGKYISIGSFQFHNKRGLKYRWNLANICNYMNLPLEG